jgi:septal ring-binding cell division protein DamX
MAATLLVSGQGVLTSQELLFGSDTLPKGDSNVHEVQMKDGVWSDPVASENVTRLIQIKGLGAEKGIDAKLACQGYSKPMVNQRWELAKGECHLEFNSTGGARVQSVSLKVSAADLDSNKIFSPKDIEYAGPYPAEVTIAFLPDPPPGEGLAPMEWLKRHITSLLVILLVAVMLTLSVWYYRNRRSEQTAPKVADADRKYPHMNATQSAATAPRLANGHSQEGPTQDVPLGCVEPIKQETAIERTLQEHSKQLLALESKDRTLEMQIEASADQYVSLLGRSSQEAEDRQSASRNETTRRLVELENRISAIQRDLSEHLQTQSSRLQDLFMDLPTVASIRADSPRINNLDLAKLEENFASVARNTALPVEKLEPLQDESAALLEAITQFVRAASTSSKEHAKKRLARVYESARVVNEELNALGQLAATQKHGFFVQMSLLEQNTLAQDLAAALTRETLKLADPEAYYKKRLDAVRVQACAAGIDLADLDVDAQRRNAALQQALANLIQVLDMKIIDPNQNDKLQAAEHQVVQFVRRAPGALPGAIAHTIVRGLQRRGEVVRKASVLLYE